MIVADKVTAYIIVVLLRWITSPAPTIEEAPSITMPAMTQPQHHARRGVLLGRQRDEQVGPDRGHPRDDRGRDQHVVDERLAGEIRRLLGALVVEQLHVDRCQGLPHGADEYRLHVLAQVVGRRIQTDLHLAFDTRKVPLMT